MFAVPVNEEEKKYLEDALDPFQEPMLIEFLNEKPQNPQEFMNKWQETKGKQIHETQVKEIKEFINMRSAKNVSIDKKS